MGVALQTFFARASSSLALWGVCAATMYWAYEPGLWVLIAGLLLRGLFEFYQMLGTTRLPHFRQTGMLLGAVLTLGALYIGRKHGPEAAFQFESAALLVSVLLVFVRQIFCTTPTKNEMPVATVAYTLLGLVYIAYLGSITANLIYFTPRAEDGRLTGHLYLLYLALVTKMSDCGAYLVGSLVGKHPMIPRISPKKTWEGFAGALAFSTLSSVALTRALPTQLALIGPTLNAVLLGLGLGLVAVLGDLAESLVKRSTSTKDSSHMLPGIGGAMDLIDSLLFTAPLLYLYLRYTPGS
jgi:phosphatidate cytidylyltransferase